MIKTLRGTLLAFYSYRTELKALGWLLGFPLSMLTAPRLDKGGPGSIAALFQASTVEVANFIVHLFTVIGVLSVGCAAWALIWGAVFGSRLRKARFSIPHLEIAELPSFWSFLCFGEFGLLCMGVIAAYVGFGVSLLSFGSGAGLFALGVVAVICGLGFLYCFHWAARLFSPASVSELAIPRLERPKFMRAAQ